MTVLAKWNGDGLASGAVMSTTLGSSTDTKFDTIDIISPAVVKVSTTGEYSPRLEWLANGSTNHMVYSWSNTLLGGATFNTHSIRFYVEFAGYPSANGGNIFSIRDTPGAVLWWLDINTLGVMRLRNVGGTAVAATQQSLALNTEYRIEGIYDNGNVTVKIFLGDHIVPLETLFGSGLNTTTPQKVQFGGPNASQYPHMYIDSVAFGNTAEFLGPMTWPESIPFRVWDGQRENIAELYGVWTGSALKQFVGAEIAP
jgi:hypothetical protein